MAAFVSPAEVDAVISDLILYGREPQKPAKTASDWGDAEKFVRHYKEVTCTYIASYFGYSRSYFSQLYQETTGQMLQTRIEEIRLEHACRLLRDTNQPCYRVGETVGLPNPAYFHRWFKRMTEMTPEEYRLYWHDQNQAAA